jgi:hypothetical protein
MRGGMMLKLVGNTVRHKPFNRYKRIGKDAIHSVRGVPSPTMAIVQSE